MKAQKCSFYSEHMSKVKVTKAAISKMLKLVLKSIESRVYIVNKGKKVKIRLDDC